MKSTLVKFIGARLGLVLITAIVLACPMQVKGITVEVLLDQNSDLPGFDPTGINGLFQAAVIDNGRYAVGVGGPAPFPVLGTFRGTIGGGLSTVFDVTTPFPDSGGTIILPLANVISGDNVVFTGITKDAAETTFSGLYNQLTPGGPLGVTANRASAFVPNLTDFAIAGSTVAYRGQVDSTPEDFGIFTVPVAGGASTTAIDITTAVPGEPGKTFTNVRMGPGGYNGDKIAFVGEFDGGSGVYTVRPGEAPVPVVTTDTPLPTTSHGDSTANRFDRPVIDGNDLAFGASTFSAGLADYAILGGTLTLVADEGTPIPGGGGSTFTNLNAGGVDKSGYALDNGRIVFRGDNGIYLHEEGTITPLLTSDSVIDGFSPVFTLTGITGQAISGDQVLITALTVSVTADEVGAATYLVTIPEPASAGLMVLATVPALIRRRSGVR